MQTKVMCSALLLVTAHADVTPTLVAQTMSQSAAQSAAQRVVPIVELGAPDAKTTQPFGNIFGVQQLAAGKVLVNDGIRRQLVILDANLAGRVVALDSASDGGSSYGRRAIPLIPFLADSTIFVDAPSQSALVIDPNGKVVRTSALPKSGDLVFLLSSASGTDSRGNLVYKGRYRSKPVSPDASAAQLQSPDSAPLLRANFETRVIDTVASLTITRVRQEVFYADAKGEMRRVTVLNPLTPMDEWSMLSDGSIAIVRGQDYHVDIIRADGARLSSAKLPFDWKRVTDEEKRALLDSARKDAIQVHEKELANVAARAADGAGAAGPARPAAVAGSSMVDAPISRPLSAPNKTPFVIEDAPLDEIADYYPSLRAGATKADADGNLWILPTTSAQSRSGELVYDVVNNKAELSRRVRIPRGRSIAGFGRGGIVYLMHRDDAGGWFLERTKLPAIK